MSKLVVAAVIAIAIIVVGFFQLFVGNITVPISQTTTTTLVSATPQAPTIDTQNANASTSSFVNDATPTSDQTLPDTMG